jgi:uncharacterized membrane protein (DUF373 family)
MSEHPNHTGGNPIVREFSRLLRVFREATPYETFEYVVIQILTALIMVITAVATFGLVVDVWQLVVTNPLDLANISNFQDVFGNIFTVIIALEFKSSLRATFFERKEVVRGRTIMLIALLAVARKFIILDLHEVSPLELLALAASALALGGIYWLIREQDAKLAIHKAQTAVQAQKPAE